MKKKVIGVIAIIIILMAVVYMTTREKAIYVNTAKVVRDNMAEYVEELAVVKMEKESIVYALTGGKVDEVLVEVGDKVKKGDVLVKLDEGELSQQIKELDIKKEGILAQYREAIKPIDEKEIDRLLLKQSTQEKIVSEAKRREENSKRLYEAGAISNEEYQVAVMELEMAEGGLKEIELELEIIKEPVSDNIIDEYEAQLKQIDIQIEDLHNKREDYIIKAPMEGIIMAKAVDVGSYVGPGTELMTIGNDNALYLESHVLMEDMPKIELGLPVEINHKELNLDKVKGSIRKIHPQAFSKMSDLGIQQKRVTVEITIEEEVESLRPEYDLDINVITNYKENILIIPENAVFKQNDKDYVFVNKNGIAELRNIEIGMESERKVEVLHGLNEGEEVIISPDEEISEGLAIRVQGDI